MSNNITGKCRLCGQIKSLSFEHVPPEKPFNSSSVKMLDQNETVKLIAGDDGRLPWDTDGLKGRIQQRGSGGYYLCKECNNNTGSWYMSEYVRFSQAMGQVLYKAVTDKQSPCSCSLSLKPFYPLRVLKGIMTMFCDINDECMGDNNLRNSLLNKESTDFDSKKYSLFLYLSKGPVWRIQGISALLSSTGSIIGLSEISTPPIGLLLITKNTKEEKINGLSINEFANYKYDEKATADFSHLPIHEVNTQMPMDFRSKEEIIQCINNNRQIRDTLFGKEVND